MDNYLIFTGSQYYPLGGAEDLLCSESNYEEAVVTLTKKCKEIGEYSHAWGHIYSLSERKIIYTY
jgi:hypothetical protein